MKFTLLVVGRTVEKHYITAIDDYVARTKHFISFDMEVIPELKNTKSLSAEQQKEKEGELILKALQPGDVVVLLDEHGKEFRSIEFADWVERKMHTVNKRLVFIIGVRRKQALTEVNGSKSCGNRHASGRATPDHRGTTGAVGASDERAGFPYDRKPRSMSRIFAAS